MTACLAPRGATGASLVFSNLQSTSRTPPKPKGARCVGSGLSSGGPCVGIAFALSALSTTPGQGGPNRLLQRNAFLLLKPLGRCNAHAVVAASAQTTRPKAHTALSKRLLSRWTSVRRCRRVPAQVSQQQAINSLGHRKAFIAYATASSEGIRISARSLKDACIGHPLPSIAPRGWSRHGGRNGFATVAVEALRLLPPGQRSPTPIVPDARDRAFGFSMRKPRPENGDARSACQTLLSQLSAQLSHLRLRRQLNDSMT